MILYSISSVAKKINKMDVENKKKNYEGLPVCCVEIAILVDVRKVRKRYLVILVKSLDMEQNAPCFLPHIL